MCATCGFVGCCESKNSHDTDHWKQTGHAIIIQMPITERSFVWCYEHNDYLTERAARPQAQPPAAGQAGHSSR
jgi:uncharacterized UBP type Zn finger protein